MRKSIAYSLMLAATLGLAACDSSSENKAEDARESAADAQESMNDARDSMNDAARQSNEAAQERIEENRDNGLNNGGATGTPTYPADTTTAPGQPADSMAPSTPPATGEE